MRLALDFGSSSLKAALVATGQPKLLTKVFTHTYPTRYSGSEVDLDPADLLIALTAAAGHFASKIKSVDCIALSVMAPAFVALDSRGKPLTRLITHQDRRSLPQALKLQKQVGEYKHLQLVGSAPVPGAVSSTTWNWLLDHLGSSFSRRVALFAHLNTFLVHALTGARVLDPGSACFTGLFDVMVSRSWNSHLCRIARVPTSILPQVLPASAIAGKVTQAAAGRFGLPAGLPVMVGAVDTSAAFALCNTKPGTLLNSSGSTDVLAALTLLPSSGPHHITRLLGLADEKIASSYLVVGNIPSAGSALLWARRTLFPSLSDAAFTRLVKTTATTLAGPSGKASSQSSLTCSADFAGSRTHLIQPTASFTGLTLGTTAQDLLKAILQDLQTRSAARLNTLTAAAGCPLASRVTLTGGTASSIGPILHARWPQRFTFTEVDHAPLRGLALI